MNLKKKNAKEFCCWLKLSNSHGLIAYSPIWLPKGEKPEIDVDQYQRAEWLDGKLWNGSVV